MYMYIQTSPVELEVVDGEGEKNGNIIIIPGSIPSEEENDEVVVVVLGEDEKEEEEKEEEKEEDDGTPSFIEDVRSFCIMHYG